MELLSDLREVHVVKEAKLQDLSLPRGKFAFECRPEISFEPGELFGIIIRILIKPNGQIANPLAGACIKASISHAYDNSFRSNGESKRQAHGSPSRAEGAYQCGPECG